MAITYQVVVVGIETTVTIKPAAYTATGTVGAEKIVDRTRFAADSHNGGDLIHGKTTVSDGELAAARAAATATVSTAKTEMTEAAVDVATGVERAAGVEDRTKTIVYTREWFPVEPRVPVLKGGCYDDDTAQVLFLDPGFLHSATMAGFLAGRADDSSTHAEPLGQRVWQKGGTTASSVYYFFGEDNGGAMSPTYSFAAPRLAGDPAPLHFLVPADVGIGGIPAEEKSGATDNDGTEVTGADSVFDAMLADPLLPGDEPVLVNGDLSYAWGWGLI